MKKATAILIAFFIGASAHKAVQLIHSTAPAQDPPAQSTPVAVDVAPSQISDEVVPEESDDSWRWREHNRVWWYWQGTRAEGHWLWHDGRTWRDWQEPQASTHHGGACAV